MTTLGIAKMPPSKDSVDSRLGAKKHTEAEMNLFVKETSSQKGFRQLAVKNHKAKNSLGESEKKIAVDRRMASQKRTKEQRVLEEQLHAFKLEKERIALGRLREQQESRQSMRTPVIEDDDDDDDIIGNPYPIALRAASRADSVENLGAAYLRGRAGRRRQSREFEDLDLNTSTGALLPGLRRSKSRGSLTSLTSVGRGTPSYSSPTKAQDRDWMGRPEAISSVRRPRKTIEQQQRDAIMSKVSSAEKVSRDSRSGVTSSRGPLKATQPVGSSEGVATKKTTRGAVGKKGTFK